MQQLIDSANDDNRDANHDTSMEDNPDIDEIDATTKARHTLNTRTLRQIAAASAINVAFCASVPALHAFLSTFPRAPAPIQHQQSTPAKSQPSSFLLVNPIALHKDTASFSAQGLSRAFAAAVEAALRTNRRLALIECARRRPTRRVPSREEDDMYMHDEDRGEPQGRRDAAAQDGESEAPEEDPWEQEVPILNATTRTFGGGSLNAVLGRTVRVRAVAERWCALSKALGG